MTTNTVEVVQRKSENVPILVKLAYGTGHVLNDLCASMWFTYLLIFFHKVLGFPHVIAGALLTIGQAADGLSTLFVGSVSDRDTGLWLCTRYGNRKSWHLIGTVCVLFSFAFIFSECIQCSDASVNAQMGYYAAFIVIFQFGWAATQVSHLAIIPELTSCKNENTSLTSVRYAATIAATVFVYIILWIYLGINSSGCIDASDAYIFRNAALICLGAGGISSLVFHLTIKSSSLNKSKQAKTIQGSSKDDVKKLERSDVENSTNLKDTISEVRHRQPMRMKDWFSEYQFYQVGCLYMFTRLFVNCTQVFMPFYLQITLQLEALYVAVIPLTMYLAGLPSAFLMKFITKLIGKKLAYGISCVIAGSGCIWVHFGCQWNVAFTSKEIFMVAVLIGLGGAAMLIISLSITADLIGQDTESSAFVYGAMSLLDKFSNGLAIMLIEQFVPTNIDDCTDCRLYYNNILAWVCSGFSLAGLVAVLSMSNTVIGKRRINKSTMSVDVNVDLK